MTLRASLNVNVPFAFVAQHLTIPSPNQALPLRTSCPVCQGCRLSIYEDTTSGGQWGYCFDCKVGGDMIELAARAWRMSPAAAIDQLGKLGLELPSTYADQERYVAEYPQARLRALTLWNTAKAQLTKVRSPELARLRARFRLYTQASPERWPRGPGRLLGAIPHGDVARIYLPTATLDDTRNTHSPFKGRDWGEVLLVPYFDLPGRICAFQAVGRRGDSQDRVFQVLIRWNPRHVTRGSYDAGIAGLDVLHDVPMQSFDRHVFAFEDSWLMLRLQFRHFNTSSIPLPIVSWHHDQNCRTQRAWQSVSRKIVFWTWQLNPRVLIQAITTNGLISLASPGHLTANIDAYLRKDTPDDLLKRSLRVAKPWREALIAWARKKPDDIVEDLLVAVEQHEPLLGPTRLAELCPDIAPWVRKMAHTTGPIRTISLANEIYEENAQGWFKRVYVCGRKKSARLVQVSDAILRLDRAFIRTNEIWYKGRVLFHGAEVPFEVTAAKLEAGDNTFIKRFLLENGHGLARIKKRYCASMVELARAFNPIEIAVPCPATAIRQATSTSDSKSPGEAR